MIQDPTICAGINCTTKLIQGFPKTKATQRFCRSCVVKGTLTWYCKSPDCTNTLTNSSNRETKLTCDQCHKKPRDRSKLKKILVPLL